jgi:hypothetical protein
MRTVAILSPSATRVKRLADIQRSGHSGGPQSIISTRAR